MTKLASTPPMTILLAFLCGTGLLALLLTFLPSFVWSDEIAADTMVRIELPNIAPRSLEAYRVIAEKSLFNLGHVADPSPNNPAPQIPTLDSYRLVGLVLAGDVKLALVERKSVKQVVTLHEGDMLDGRHVDDISETGVALSGTTGPEILSMPKPVRPEWSIATPNE